MSTSQPPARRVVRQIEVVRPANFDEQLWPVNLALLLLAGFVAGLIAAHSDFEAQDWLRNGWIHLGMLSLIVVALLISTAALSYRVQRRMQFAVFCSLLLHVWLSLVGTQLHLEALAANDADASLPAEFAPLPTLPDYYRGDTPRDQREPDEVETPVETLPENETDPQVERMEVEPEPTEKTADDRTLPAESPTPVPMDLERMEPSAPREDVSISAPEISRQLLETPSVEMPNEDVPEMAPAESAESLADQLEAAAAAFDRSRSDVETERATEMDDAPAPEFSTSAERETALEGTR